jgi:hypothetical protein
MTVNNALSAKLFFSRFFVFFLFRRSVATDTPAGCLPGGLQSREGKGPKNETGKDESRSSEKTDADRNLGLTDLFLLPPSFLFPFPSFLFPIPDFAILLR